MKINVYTTFSEFGTWNVMNNDTGICEFYGSIDEMEAWLVENKNKVTIVQSLTRNHCGGYYDKF